MEEPPSRDLSLSLFMNELEGDSPISSLSYGMEDEHQDIQSCKLEVSITEALLAEDNFNLPDLDLSTLSEWDVNGESWPSTFGSGVKREPDLPDHSSGDSRHVCSTSGWLLSDSSPTSSSLLNTGQKEHLSAVASDILQNFMRENQSLSSVQSSIMSKSNVAAAEDRLQRSHAEQLPGMSALKPTVFTQQLLRQHVAIDNALDKREHLSSDWKPQFSVSHKEESEAEGQNLRKNGFDITFSMKSNPAMIQAGTLFSEPASSCLAEFQPSNPSFVHQGSMVSELALLSSPQKVIQGVPVKSENQDEEVSCFPRLADSQGKRQSYSVGFQRKKLKSDMLSHLPAETLLANKSLLLGSPIGSQLMMFAEALVTDDLVKTKFLLRVLLQKANHRGDFMQRVAVYFLEGLKVRAGGLGAHSTRQLDSTKQDVDKSRTAVQTQVPYWDFMAQILCAQLVHAMEGASRVHILDLSLWGSDFWPQMLNSICQRQGGPPVLRVTKVLAPGELTKRNLVNAGYDNGNHILKAARHVGLPIEFNQVDVKIESLTAENLMLRSDEVLIINGSMRLYTLLSDSVLRHSPRDAALRALQKLKPKAMLFTEMYGDQNGPFFLARLKDAIEFYGSIFESFDEAIPGIEVKQAYEQLTGKNIVNVVAGEGAQRVIRIELPGKWRKRFEDAGFVCQVTSDELRRCMNNYVHQYSPDYSVTEEAGMLVLNWKKRGIVMSSLWRLAK